MSVLSIKNIAAKLVCVVCCLASVLWAGNVYALACDTLPEAYVATYSGSFKGWSIKTTQSLKFDSAKQEWAMTIMADNLIGDIKEQSIFSFDNDGDSGSKKIKSLEYIYQRKVLGRDRVQELDFDWVGNKVVASGRKSATLNLSGGELDRLNHQLLLQCDVMAGKTHFLYNVVDKDEMEVFEYKKVGEEKIETKLGVFETVIVRRQRNDDDRVTTIWFAKNKGYLMVKLLQEEKKDAEAYLLYIDSVKSN